MSINKDEELEMILENAQIDTQAIRAGRLKTDLGSHGEPIFATSSFVFDSAAQAAARFSGDEPGNIYSRFSNPTVSAFEEKLAIMEGGEQCVATASGMAAIMATALALLEQGDHIVCSRSVFGTTTVLHEKYLKKFGVSTTVVDLVDLSAWESAIQDNTKYLFLETPSNPICEVADIKKLADLAHSKGCLLVVDNCFCTPALQRPLALGADIIIHSATKYLDGQGRTIGGAVVGSKVLMTEVYGVLRTCGPTMSPFNAWVALKGLETLGIRMKAHSHGAQAIAEWLEQQAEVEQVHYSGLKSNPRHALAVEQQSGFGGVLSFVVNGGRNAAWKFIDATRIFSITANLGDTKSTITHPATTTHGRISDDDKVKAKIEDGLIRLSVGLEHVDDLIDDLKRGLTVL